MRAASQIKHTAVGIVAAAGLGACAHYFFFGNLEADLNTRILGITGGLGAIAAALADKGKKAALTDLTNSGLDDLRQSRLRETLVSLASEVVFRRFVAAGALFLAGIFGSMFISAKLELWRPVFGVFGYQTFFIGLFNFAIMHYEIHWVDTLEIELTRRRSDAIARKAAIAATRENHNSSATAS